MRISYRLRKYIPLKWKVALLRTLFGFLPDSDKKISEVVKHNRLVMATRYLRGQGIEIGALGRPCPVPPDLIVKQVDRFDDNGLYENFDKIRDRKVICPDIIDDAETLSKVPDQSQDFVIANHVIEHMPNPILFIESCTRVLRSSGILYLAIPDKEKTFDRDREVTDFDHLMRDYRDGPASSRLAHYEDFVRHADTHNGRQSWSNDEEFRAQVKHLMENDYSIHFHVWDMPSIIKLFIGVCDKMKFPLVTEALISTGNEVIIVLRKRQESRRCVIRRMAGTDSD